MYFFFFFLVWSKGEIVQFSEQCIVSHNSLVSMPLIGGNVVVLFVTTMCSARMSSEMRRNTLFTRRSQWNTAYCLHFGVAVSERDHIHIMTLFLETERIRT